MGKKGRIFIAFLGTVFILFGTLMLYLNLQVIRYGEKLEGLVVGYESREQSSTKGTRGSTDAPVVEFSYKGDTLRIPAQMSSAWHGFSPGDRVTLYFDPANDKEVIVDSFYQKYGFGGLFILCGIIQFVVILVMGKKGNVN